LNAAFVTAVVLALSVLAGSVRLLWPRPAATGVRPWRTALLLIGQAAAALLLYLAMFPLNTRTTPEALVVITAHATDAQLARFEPQAGVVALPEAPASAAVERVADLATALRRDRAVERLKIVGAGLPPRDRDVARHLSLEFDPAPRPRGLVELRSPRRVTSGSSWRVSGVINDVPGGTVELLDPSQQRVGSVSPGDNGRFTLQADARMPGRAPFRLRIRDAAQTVVEDVEVPLLTVAGTPLRLRVLSGAPSPELKYLRRWALDAGVQLQSELALRPGVRVLRSAAPLSADALQELEVVILDERAWQSLGTAGRDTLVDALRAGLGVVIRLTGTLTDRDRRELQALGFDVRDADLPRTIRLAEVQTALTRRPVHVESRDGVPLLRDGRGEPLALWRAEGRGRIALWWLSDSYRLALDGSPTLHGTLWSDALATVARARGPREPEFVNADPRLHARQLLCGLDADAEASVQAPDGRRVPLLRESSGCAAYWPESAGWHVLDTGDGDWPFHVRAAGEAPGLHAQELLTATAAMVANRSQRPGAPPSRGAPGAPWSYLLGCLIALGATWWLERSRVGRT
jgi:hypothetical protein